MTPVAPAVARGRRTRGGPGCIPKTDPEPAFRREARWRARIAFFGAISLALAGCQSTPGEPSARPKLDKTRSVEITPADEEFGRQRSASGQAARRGRARSDAAELTEGELYELPKFTVSKKGFAKFGLSVVTNTEVAIGGPIEWMRVGVVLPGSPAARQGLFTGIEILAIDNQPVAELSRDGMLRLVFEREAGDHVRLLVYSRQFGPLPRFLTL